MKTSTLFSLLLALLVAVASSSPRSENANSQASTRRDLTSDAQLHTQPRRSSPAPPPPALPLTRRQQSPGAACSSEGQWNCLTRQWQRCASGQWSVVMDLAEGTACAPAGLSDEFHVDHEGRGGRSTSSAAPSKGVPGPSTAAGRGVSVLHGVTGVCVGFAVWVEARAWI
ncbi:hypothetical protein D7B24_003268 [Verticillium nonalfalfae]|uniref:Extracellular membrane protein CFEM domain-containing protein n=1 Tax=Verticillium nonalfalfae TaxID=1051616 RepID=A0A3M9YG75_9PEZI|nr:uncharacterized protein D7B24_003268 [Verticillium nonalfalfae]RNJ59175.1 hypothetical protein D7B24_003268 [Verticillium nonalfalfae]